MPDLSLFSRVVSDSIANTYVADHQHTPFIAPLVGGGYVVVWTSIGSSWLDSQDGYGYGVYARVYDSAGDPASAEIQINEVVDGFEFPVAAVGLADGGFAVAYTSMTPRGGPLRDPDTIFIKSFVRMRQ